LNEISELKELYQHTEIVVSGEPRCVIQTPEDSEHRNIGEGLADALFQLSGAEIPVVTGAAPRTQNVIALGQMINNPLIERLYWNRYLFLDSLWPGAGGHVIQSVHSPYPWTSPHNIIVLGGSNSIGVLSAVESFLRRFEQKLDLVLPPTLEVVLPNPEDRNTKHTVLGQTYSSVMVPEANLTEEDALILLEQEPGESLLEFQELAAKYLLTGERPYMEAGSRVLIRMCELYEQDPQRKMSWPEETNSRYIFAMWDAVEESVVFNDEERIRITRMLHQFLRALVPLTSNYENLEEHGSILWNHTTFPLLGLYFGGRYFNRYYGLKETNAILRKASAAFAGQEKTWKPQCDADSYLTLTMSHTIEYALAEARTAFFDAGHLETYADYLIGISDNEGRASGFGDSSLQRTNSVPLSGVQYAFWYSRNPKYLGYLDSVSDGAWPNPYHQDVTPTLSDDTNGIRIYRLSTEVYDYTTERPYYNEASGPLNIPFEQSFDKIAYRSGSDRGDQYFLLDGYGRGKHYHYDTNAILKMTQAGIDWLVDSDYLVRNTTEHNMVSVIIDGRVDSPIPECAGVLCSGDTPGFGFTETVVRDYNHVDWYRSVFWKKGDWIVIIDRLQALSRSSFTFDAVWKVLDHGDIRLSDDTRTLTIERQARWDDNVARSHTFTLQNASFASSTVRRRSGTAGPVGILLQRHEARLSAGEAFSIQNLLHITNDSSSNVTLKKLNETTGLLVGPTPAILGCGGHQGAGLEIEADLYLLGTESIALAGATRFLCGEVLFTSQIPVALEIHVPTGETFLVAAEKTTVERRGATPLQMQPGTHKITLGFGEEEHQILARVLSLAKPTDESVRKSIPAAASQTVPSLEPIWTRDPDSNAEEIRAAIPWPESIAHRGPENFLVCQGRKLKCYDSQGAILWTFTSKDLMRCVATADIDGDGNHEILCGGNDEHIYLLSHHGHLLNQHHMTERLIIGQGGTENPCVNNLLAESFGEFSDIRIVAGCTNSQISMFDSNFNRVWNRGAIYHGVHKLQSADLQGEGKKTILAADHYGGVHCISPAGEFLGRVYSELGDVEFGVADIDGDGRLEIINGSGTGMTVATDCQLNTLWNFQTHGYNVRQILCLDLDGDGMSETLVASDTGFVYALDDRGRVIWQAALGSPVLAMENLNSGTEDVRFAAGMASGETAVMNAHGTIVARYPGKSPVKFLLSTDQCDGTSQLLIVDWNERIRVVS
jgi:hypothetical protein